jgi:hypothetical protein
MIEIYEDDKLVVKIRGGDEELRAKIYLEYIGESKRYRIERKEEAKDEYSKL